MIPRLAVTATLLLVLVTTAQSVSADKPEFAARDIFDLEYVADPQVSPRGDQVVFERTFMDIMTDRSYTNLWTAAYDGSSLRPLTTGTVNHTSPRWSPNADRVAFLAKIDGNAEIMVRWMDTLQTARVTRLTQSASNIAWSPDGTHIAFTMHVSESTPKLAKMPAKPEGARWARPPTVIESLVYRADGDGYLEEGYTQVFVVPADGGSARQLTHGDFNHNSELTWLPDGSGLLLTSNRHEDWEYDPNNTEIYRVTLTGEISALTDRQGPDGDQAISPDGDTIAYSGFDDALQGYQVRQLYVMDADGSNTRLIDTGLDRDIINPTFGRDGKGLFFQYDDQGDTHIAYSSLKGKLTPVASALGGTTLGRPYSSGTYSIGGRDRIAYTHVSPFRPADLAVVNGNGSGLRVLSHFNDDLLGERDLAQIEEIWFESSFDQRRIQGWIAKPPGFDPDQKYPLILEIHGGPFANYGPRFAAEIQLYAAAGYVVLYTNPRGSTSYGGEFGNLIHHAYPGNDYDDLMSGVDATVAKGYVDAERLYVTGGSGGGVLTAWIVGKTDRFRAAVSAKPVINWYSFALTSDFYNFFYRYWFPGPPWEHQEQYMARSPVSLVGNVTTPTMLLTGELDYRTPISESEQYYQALKLRRIDTALVRIPGASHGIAARPSQLIAKAANILAWFQRYGGQAR